MDLKIYSAHTGRSLNVPYDVNSLPQLRKWIAQELGITDKYLVLMTARGSQVKPQYWADESEIYAFDREFLSKRTSKVPAEQPSVPVPNIPPPPDASQLNTKSTLKEHLAHLRSRALWARSVANQAQDINSQIDTINSEIKVLHISAKIALVNLGNVSRSLERAFADTEMLAEKKVQTRQETLERIPYGLQVLDNVKIHPIFGKEERTLGDFFDKQKIAQAQEVCRKAIGNVEQRVKGLKNNMNDFIRESAELKRQVVDWITAPVQDGGQLREISLIADKIERDFNHITEMANPHTALSASARSFQNHVREYIPSIQTALASLLQNLEAAYELRRTVSTQSQNYLQRLSSAQERMVSIGPRLAEADEVFNEIADSYDLLRGIESVANGYGQGLMEGFRRGLWKIKRAKLLEKARKDVEKLRSQERGARKAWGEVSSDGGVVWGLVDDFSSEEDASSPISNGIDGESEYPVARKDIEQYISTISKSLFFENVARSLKEHLSILLMSIQSSELDAGTSPPLLDSPDPEMHSVKTREGSQVYEQLLRDKTVAEERARNFESRVKNLEEMLHRQFRTPPRHFSPRPVTTSSTSTSPQFRQEGFDEPLLGRSVIRTDSPELTSIQKRVQDLEQEKAELMEKFAEADGTKNDLMANLEEQTKLFQAEREDLIRKAGDLEREVERHETEISRFEELVPKMEVEMETLRKGRQNLLREMNLLQTESGAKIKELEEAKQTAEDRMSELERDGQQAAAETARITGEWRKASSAAEDANVELERFRRLSDEQKVDQDKFQKTEEELRVATTKLAEIEEEKSIAAAAHDNAVNAIREELSTLRERLIDLFALEKRRWETDSLLHVIGQRLAAKDRSISEFDTMINSLSKDNKTLSAQLAKSKALCASRTLKARDLTQRLYTQHTRCKQLLETLGLPVKSSNGTTLTRYGSSDKSDYLEPDDLDLLYWMESGDSDEEADKYSRYLGRIVIDLDAFSQSITNRVRDAEKYAKKWQKEARAYRDRSKRATADAENKIAFRQFKEGDLALFLPTNNGRPWAAFNVNAPHYFLRENEAHRLGGGRDWLLARITKVEERTVDLANHPSDAEEHNPFDLADGLRWYYLDAIEEKPSTLASRELARSMALQKSELRTTEKKSTESSRKRLSQSTPGLIPGHEGGDALVHSAIHEEEEV